MPAENGTEAAQRRRRHICIVDDSPPILDLLRELLEAEGYVVSTTTFQPTTFEHIATLLPALLLVDLVVGERAGWGLLARLHAEETTRGLPVIVLSTSPELLDQARALATPGGTRRFLAKPFDLGALLALVEELIGPA